jgi:hypothetical protein
MAQVTGVALESLCALIQIGSQRIQPLVHAIGTSEICFEHGGVGVTICLWQSTGHHGNGAARQLLTIRKIMDLFEIRDLDENPVTACAIEEGAPGSTNLFGGLTGRLGILCCAIQLLVSAQQMLQFSQGDETRQC